MKKLSILLWVFFVLVGCSRDSGEEVRVSFVIPGTKNSEAEFLPRLSFPVSRALPSTGTGFDCIGLNIIGPGIPSRLGQAVPTNVINLIDGGSQCTYPGSSSLLVKPGASDTEVTAFVPAGALRLLQVVGLQKTSDTSCTFPITFSDLWVKKYLDPTNANVADFVNAYEIGRKIVSLPIGTREARFDITDSYNQVATKPLAGDTDSTKNCPSLSPNDTMTCKAVMTVAKSSSITKSVIPYIQNGTAPYTFSGTFSSGTLSAATGDYSYSTATASTDTGVTVTDAKGKTTACTVELKMLSSTTLPGATLQTWWVADDSSYMAGNNTLSGQERFQNQTLTTVDANLSVNAASSTNRFTPYVRFNLPSSSVQMNLQGNISNDLVLLAVVRFDSVVGDQVAVNINRGSSDLSIQYNQTATGAKTFVARAGSENIELGSGDNDWHLHQVRLKPVKDVMYAVSGFTNVVSRTLTNTPFFGSTTSLHIGKSATASTNLSGGVAEVVVLESPSAANITTVVSYLKAKYGL